MTEIFIMPFANGRIADVWGRRHLPSDETARHEPVLAIVGTHPRSWSLQAITGPDPGDDSGGYPSSLVIEMPLAAAPPRTAWISVVGRGICALAQGWRRDEAVHNSDPPATGIAAAPARSSRAVMEEEVT
jgi:hypothetical protein